MLCVVAVLVGFSVLPLYLSCIHLFDWRGRNRDSNSSIIRRVLGVVVSSVIQTFAVACLLVDNDNKITLSKLLGLTSDGALASIALPLLLTAILFSGPLLLSLLDGSLFNALDFRYLKSIFCDLINVRNIIIAPISEEYAFRACVVPFLLECFSFNTTCLVTPSVFALAHFHHVLNHTRTGDTLKTAFLKCSFQAIYTYIFGLYATYLFMRTGNLISPIVAHMFCNSQGFPEFQEIFDYKGSIRIAIISVFVSGLILFLVLLAPLTDKSLYVV